MPLRTWLPRRRRELSDATHETIQASLYKRTADTPTGLALGLTDKLLVSIASVEVDSLAWRAGVEVGDHIRTITLTATRERFTITDTQQVIQVLSDAHGELVLRLRRKRWTVQDSAAQLLQAIWRGKMLRGLKDGRMYVDGHFLPPSPLAPARLSDGSIDDSSRPSTRPSSRPSSSGAPDSVSEPISEGEGEGISGEMSSSSQEEGEGDGVEARPRATSSPLTLPPLAPARLSSGASLNDNSSRSSAGDAQQSAAGRGVDRAAANDDSMRGGGAAAADTDSSGVTADEESDT
jgi:hypothetical protein